jgi:hypothetical protein
MAFFSDKFSLSVEDGCGDVALMHKRSWENIRAYIFEEEMT